MLCSHCVLTVVHALYFGVRSRASTLDLNPYRLLATAVAMKHLRDLRLISCFVCCIANTHLNQGSPMNRVGNTTLDTGRKITLCTLPY